MLSAVKTQTSVSIRAVCGLGDTSAGTLSYRSYSNTEMCVTLIGRKISSKIVSFLKIEFTSVAEIT
jgi:hypothetical protein